MVRAPYPRRVDVRRARAFQHAKRKRRSPKSHSFLFFSSSSSLSFVFVYSLSSKIFYYTFSLSLSLWYIYIYIDKRRCIYIHTHTLSVSVCLSVVRALLRSLSLSLCVWKRVKSLRVFFLLFFSNFFLRQGSFRLKKLHFCLKKFCGTKIREQRDKNRGWDSRTTCITRTLIFAWNRLQFRIYAPQGIP